VSFTDSGTGWPTVVGVLVIVAAAALIIGAAAFTARLIRRRANSNAGIPRKSVR
jgi:hypothetical protein